MIYHRERPICRQILLIFLKKFDCTLEELLHRSDVYLTPKQRRQAHKMLKEGRFRTGLQIYKEERQEKFMRSVGMIR